MSTSQYLQEDDKLLNLSISELETSFSDSNASLSPCMVSKPHSEMKLASIRTTLITQALQFSDEDSAGANNESIPLSQSENQVAVPQANKARSVYLVTYSQADAIKVPSRAYFAEIVINEFNRNDKIVDKWVCGAEIHNETRGFHCHLAIKLHSQRRWRQVRQNLKQNHKIDVDFQDFHTCYFDAYSYVTKHDLKHAEMSKNHPLLDNVAPQTAKALKQRRLSSVTSSSNSSRPVSTSKFKRRRLDIAELHNIIVVKNIRNDQQLCALAKVQMKEGKQDLQRYLLSHPSAKHRLDVIETVWSMEEGELRTDRRNQALLIILEEMLNTNCAQTDTGLECCGSWLIAALETLERNGISREFFAQKVKMALQHGLLQTVERHFYYNRWSIFMTVLCVLQQHLSILSEQ